MRYWRKSLYKCNWLCFLLLCEFGLFFQWYLKLLFEQFFFFGEIFHVLSLELLIEIKLEDLLFSMWFNAGVYLYHKLRRRYNNINFINKVDHYHWDGQNGHHQYSISLNWWQIVDNYCSYQNQYCEDEYYHYLSIDFRLCFEYFEAIQRNTLLLFE